MATRNVVITVAAYTRLLRDRRAFLLATRRSLDPKRNAADRAYYRREVAKP